MPIGALNSSLTRKGYLSDEMAEIWGERETIARVVEVESALAAVQGELGIIPARFAAIIVEYAYMTDELVAKISAGKVGNPLVAALDAIRAQIPEEARGFVHYGATSQDILDTARARQILMGMGVLDEKLKELIGRLRQLAGEHAQTLMVARTNGQYALPTTLGMRFARWLRELQRAQARLAQTVERAAMIQFSGAAGTYAATGEQGVRVAQALAQRLGLTFEIVPWHASRDGITELCCNLAILGQSLAKIAEDLFAMQQSDMGEAHEQMDAHSSGSSAMPQKLNPFTTMKVSVNARLAAGLAATVLTAPPGTFERDHRQLEVERDALGQIFTHIDGALTKLLGLFSRLSFDVEKLRDGVKNGGELLMSESVMMVLAPRIGHEAAHDLIQEFAKAQRSEGISLAEYIGQRTDLALSDSAVADLQEALDPRSYLGLSVDIARGVAAGE
ncbi:lyase family protein [Trueperella sp. LYQ143]|uniref:lyase family protein n=1 Tax=Trueperella sp. LYQ143 TaxID=3391059 RepID=UPI0039834B04